MDAKMAVKVIFVVNSELLIFRKFDSLIQFHDTNRAKSNQSRVVNQNLTLKLPLSRAKRSKGSTH